MVKRKHDKISPSNKNSIGVEFVPKFRDTKPVFVSPVCGKADSAENAHKKSVGSYGR